MTTALALVLLLASLAKPDTPRVIFRTGPVELLPLEPSVVVRWPPAPPPAQIRIITKLPPAPTVRL